MPGLFLPLIPFCITLIYLEISSTEFLSLESLLGLPNIWLGACFRDSATTSVGPLIPSIDENLPPTDPQKGHRGNT